MEEMSWTIEGDYVITLDKGTARFSTLLKNGDRVYMNTFDDVKQAILEEVALARHEKSNAKKRLKLTGYRRSGAKYTLTGIDRRRGAVTCVAHTDGAKTETLSSTEPFYVDAPSIGDIIRESVELRNKADRLLNEIGHAQVRIPYFSQWEVRRSVEAHDAMVDRIEREYELAKERCNAKKD